MGVGKPIMGVLMDGLWVTEAQSFLGYSEEPYRIQLRTFPQRNGKAGNIYPLTAVPIWLKSILWVLTTCLELELRKLPWGQRKPSDREAKRGRSL